MSSDEGPSNSWVNLILAIAEATGQLATGIHQVVGPRWNSLAGQTAFQDMAGGVERLAKITNGLWFEEEHGRYPKDSEAREAGHKIPELVAAVQAGIEDRATAAGKTYILGLCKALRDDPNWPMLVEVLNTAADATTGRYRQTAIMGGKDLSGAPSAYQLWEAIEHDVITDLGLWGSIADISSFGQGPSDSLVRARGVTLHPLLRWWHLVYRAWQHGLAGSKSQRFSTEIGLEFEQLPDALKEFVKGL